MKAKLTEEITHEFEEYCCENISDPHLFKHLTENIKMDVFISLNHFSINHIINNEVFYLALTIDTMYFNDLFEVIDFINESKINNFFYFNSINVESNKVYIKYKKVPLSYEIIGKESMRKSRTRDKKIMDVLKNKNG